MSELSDRIPDGEMHAVDRHGKLLGKIINVGSAVKATAE